MAEEQDELNKKQVEEFRKLKSRPGGVHTAGGEKTGHYPGSHCTPQGQSDQEEIMYETDEEEFNNQEDIQWIPEEANPSRGNSTRQLVDLGQSNGSSGDILVNGPECLQRQDENPCMKTVWEMDAGGGGGIGEDGEDDTQGIPEEANLSRGNSTRQLVDLGQSNGSSGDILVNTPEYLQRQDEHPCMNTVWEMDTEVGGGMGGGMGGTERRETDISSQDNMYETDEEEFCQAEPIHYEDPVQVREPPKKTRKTAKRDVSARANRDGYNLSYFNLWWSRMAVEGRREEKESRRTRMEKEGTGKAKLSKPGDGKLPKLSDSSRSNGWHNRMGPQGGEVKKNLHTYMDEAKMGNFENIREQVLVETTVGVRGVLDERESHD